MSVLLYCGVCTSVRLLPPGEKPIAIRNNNNNNNNYYYYYYYYYYKTCYLHHQTVVWFSSTESILYNKEILNDIYLFSENIIRFPYVIRFHCSRHFNMVSPG
jgi:hypothetical protein